MYLQCKEVSLFLGLAFHFVVELGFAPCWKLDPDAGGQLPVSAGNSLPRDSQTRRLLASLSTYHMQSEESAYSSQEKDRASGRWLFGFFFPEYPQTSISNASAPSQEFPLAATLRFVSTHLKLHSPATVGIGLISSFGTALDLQLVSGSPQQKTLPES